MPSQGSSHESGVEAIYRQFLLPGQSEVAAAEPAPAVAAVLWRRSPSGIEVYLVQRSAQVRFLPGQWSFPGGGITPADHQVSIAGASGDEAVRIAALIREVEEETGLRLPGQAHAFVPAGCFITPAFSPIRFAAWFYLVEVPVDAVTDFRASRGELQDEAWMSPRQALMRWQEARMVIPQPNRRMLAALEPGIEGAAERCQAAAERENASLRAYELVPGIFVAVVRTPTLPPATHTNCYLVGSRDLVVIDPASPYEEERAALDQAIDDLVARGHRVVEIWLTHHHADHVSGAAHLKARLGVPVAAHAHTASRLASRVAVDRLLDDGTTLDLAGEPRRRVRAVFTPGHAPGHVCVLEEHTGFLIAGDMVAGVGTIVIEPSEGSMRQYLASLERMKALGAAALLPAHGPMSTDAAAKLDEYITHRLWREQKIVDALRRTGAATPRELVPLAYDDVPVFIHALAEHSLVAHLVKLEEDGMAGREGATWRLREP